jgi:hypothetical protein
MNRAGGSMRPLALCHAVCAGGRANACMGGVGAAG